MTDRKKLEGATRRHLTDHGANLSDLSFGDIRYNRGEKLHHAQVGHPDPEFGEEIVCILRDDTRKLYNICTENRGVRSGNPIQVGQVELLSANVMP